MLTEQELVSKDLQIVRVKDFDYVYRLLRQVTLLHEKKFHPYQASSITLEPVSISDVRPCALYVLEQGLETARQLRDALLTQGIDTLGFTKDKAHIIYNWRGQLNCIISPPVVEVSEDDGNIPVVTDGLHRFFLAKVLDVSHINSIVIRNIACPLPALPVEWNEVKMCQSVPPSDKKRRFRFNTIEELEQWPTLSQRNQDRFLQGIEDKSDFLQQLSIRVPELHSNQRLTF